MAVLAVGDPDDASLGYIVWLARSRSIDTIVLAEAELGVGWWVTCPEDPGEWALHVGDRTVTLDEVSGALVRLNPRPATPPTLALDAHESAFFVVERRSGLLWFLDRAPFVVINRPSRGRSNGCKPVHMAELQVHGLTVPRWCVSNDPSRAHAFVETCANGAIYKAVSGLRSHVRAVDQALWTRLHEGTTPVILQERVGTHDVRVHVIGNDVVGTEVLSEEVDYRFATSELTYRSVIVPDDIAIRCRQAAGAAGLLLAGLDFRVDESSQWFCLEMNPVPTFLPYEAGSGQRIGDLIVDALAPGTRTPLPASPLHLIDANAGPAGRPPRR